MKSYLVHLIHRFKSAFSGMFHGMLHDRSILQHWIAAVSVLFLFFLFFSFNGTSFSFLILVIVIVLAFEYVNSAIEEIVDILFPNYDLRAKKIKDYAAAAVLLISIAALIIGFSILLGRYL